MTRVPAHHETRAGGFRTYSPVFQCRGLVVKRFREGAISSGKAARILGISRREFLERLAREGFPIYAPTDEELAQELQTVRKTQPADA